MKSLISLHRLKTSPQGKDPTKGDQKMRITSTITPCARNLLGSVTQKEEVRSPRSSSKSNKEGAEFHEPMEIIDKRFPTEKTWTFEGVDPNRLREYSNNEEDNPALQALEEVKEVGPVQKAPFTRDDVGQKGRIRLKIEEPKWEAYWSPWKHVKAGGCHVEVVLDSDDVRVRKVRKQDGVGEHSCRRRSHITRISSRFPISWKRLHSPAVMRSSCIWMRPALQKQT